MAIVVFGSAGFRAKYIAFGLPDLSWRPPNSRLTLSARNVYSLFLIAIPAGSRAKEVPPIFNRLVISRNRFSNQLAAAFALDCLHCEKYNTVCDRDNF